QEFASVFVAHLGKDLGSLLKITVIGHRQRDLVPDVREILGVIKDGRSEDLRVGKLHDSSGGLIALDPVSNLEHAGVKESDVDYVAGELIDLNSIFDGKHVAGENGQAPGYAQQRFTQGHRETCADQAQERAAARNHSRPEHNNDGCRDYHEHRVEKALLAVLLGVGGALVAEVRVAGKVHQTCCHEGCHCPEERDGIWQPMHLSLVAVTLTVVAQKISCRTRDHEIA